MSRPPTAERTARGHRLLSRISRLELAAAGVAVIVAVVLVALEPNILEAPFENARTVGFTVGGTVAAAIAFAVMLRLGVHPIVRVLVLGVPLAGASWWLLSPFFLDEEVNDDFATSIAAAADQAPPQTSSTVADAESDGVATTVPAAPEESTPVLLGAGQLVGLAGHEGTGTAGFFALADGSQVLRLEDLDIQNGPDLRLYVVPGAEQTSPSDASLYLGELRGNVGNQTYELPSAFELTPGDWTVLVWCEAFTVEFVGATVTVA